jgi:pyruvate/2-oxoglutarate dehydrogenase complex dihydrolipoamide dehydrogenase (E3) component
VAEKFDVVVIGGGTAGLVTASGCARLGRHVALIEREALGGDCLWTGCVPTKALVASARLAHQASHADAYGFEPVRLEVNPKRILDSMREARRDISRHDDPEKFRKLGIDVIEGEARLTSRTSVLVGDRQLEARDIVIATGSRTSVPRIEGLSETGFLDHATFLQQDAMPRSIVVLGGGYIGIEFAQIFRRFGAEVTVVEMTDAITPHEDHEVIDAVCALLTEEGITIRTGCKATKVRREGSYKVVTLERGSELIEVEADEIFVASGRRGNVENLGLEENGVAIERNYVKVDEYLRTSVPNIWACGDIHGGLQFTHVAAYEAVKLVRNMLFPGKSAVDYEHLPWALYTDPEVGHIGLTEHQASAKFGAANIRTYKVTMHDVDRAVVDRTGKGFIKFVCDGKGTILGAHALCSHASTLIEEVVLARKKRMKIGELAQLVSPYPSLADGIGKAASLYYQELSSSWLGAVAKKVAAISQS